MTLSNPAQYISGRTVQEQMNSLIDYVDQRAAEVATDAIAADVAQVHQDMLDADADATAAAASAAAAAGTLANAVKKTGEASQSIAGDIAVGGTLDAASIGSGSTPVVCGNLTAYGSVSLDDTTLQGNLSGADASALINLSGVGSVLVPTPTSNSEAATKKYVDDALDNYAPMLRTTGDQSFTGIKHTDMAGSSSANAGKDVQPRVSVQSTGFDRTLLQGISRHYPMAGLLDKNGDVVVKIVASTSDSAIGVYLQAIALDGTTQATKLIGSFDRASGTWS